MQHVFLFIILHSGIGNSCTHFYTLDSLATIMHQWKLTFPYLESSEQIAMVALLAVSVQYSFLICQFIVIAC